MSKYNNHTTSFRNRAHENDSKLSKFIWSLKDQIKNLILNGPFLKRLLDQNCAIFVSFKKLVISNKKGCSTNSQIYHKLIVIFICPVSCIYKKLFEKVNITSEGL